MKKFTRIMLSKWSLSLYLLLVTAYVMPLNSPLRVPSEIKPVIAVVSIILIFNLLFMKHDHKATSQENKKSGDGSYKP